MNFFKQKTIDLIKLMPEEKMPYVFNIVQNVFALADARLAHDDSEDAFTALLAFHKKISPANSYEA